MKYLTGNDRNQIPLFVGCLEEAIESDNEVRLIDAFVNALPLENFGFKLDLTEKLEYIDKKLAEYNQGPEQN